MNLILQTLRSFDGVLEIAPGPGSKLPELAWGDHFFYFAPDGQVPQREQPYATIVTKDYPGDTLSDLDHPHRWRLNIHVGAAMFTELTGERPWDEPAAWNYAAAGTVLPHPVYRTQGWVCIVNVSDGIRDVAVDLLQQAHAAARRRTERRATAPGVRPDTA